MQWCLANILFIIEHQGLPEASRDIHDGIKVQYLFIYLKHKMYPPPTGYVGPIYQIVGCSSNNYLNLLFNYRFHYTDNLIHQILERNYRRGRKRSRKENQITCQEKETTTTSGKETSRHYFWISRKFNQSQRSSRQNEIINQIQTRKQYCFCSIFASVTMDSHHR